MVTPEVHENDLAEAKVREENTRATYLASREYVKRARQRLAAELWLQAIRERKMHEAWLAAHPEAASWTD